MAARPFNNPGIADFPFSSVLTCAEQPASCRHYGKVDVAVETVDTQDIHRLYRFYQLRISGLAVCPENLSRSIALHADWVIYA
jgi:hypothetical protein